MLRVLFLFLLKESSCYLVLPKNGLGGSMELVLVNESYVEDRALANGIPDYFDWRDTGHISPVKDQHTCNACWAFSAVASIESHVSIQTNQKIILSEQFLIDCDNANKGCGSASILETFSTIVSKFGGVLRDEDYYPYESRRSECRWSRPELKPGFLEGSKPGPMPVPVVGFRRVNADEDIMVKYLYAYGPLATAINDASMAKYEGGIDEPTDEICDPKILNHAVLIVGYNTYVSKRGEKLPYWIIKNSWGTQWGDEGFYYLVRGRNACGVASDVSFPFVA